MDDTRLDQLSRIREHASRNRQAVLFDEPSGTLFDIASGKTLPVDLANLERVEERVNKETKLPYLVLLYGDGRQLVLADIGIAYPPIFAHTGPLPELPEAVCFRDFLTLSNRLQHELYGHPEDAPNQNTLRLLMMCLAILDGARTAGFDIAREERALEKHLSEVERRAPKATDPKLTPG